MKNVFMLKADRLSNLLLCLKSFAYNVGTDWEDSEEQGNISLGVGEYANKEFYEPQEIYITSEDPIKEGDWCLYNKNHNSEKPCWEIIKCGKIENEYMHAQSDGKLILWMKNIIVTTNPVLIADLVQAVKKNFIMYFIANKGLDFIEVTDFFIASKNLHHGFPDRYRLEFKPVYLTEKKVFDNYLKELNEAANKYANSPRDHAAFIEGGKWYREKSLDTTWVPYHEWIQHSLDKEMLLEASRVTTCASERTGFIMGTLWKSEKTYSAEEVQTAFKAGFSIGYGSDTHGIEEKEKICSEWFEKFKK